MKVGDLIKIDSSVRKNGRYAGKLGLILGKDSWGGFVVNVENEVRKFHSTQIAGVVNQ